MLISTFAPSVFAGQEEDIKDAKDELTNTPPPINEDASLTSIVETGVPLTPYYEEITIDGSSAIKVTFAGAAIFFLVAGIFYFRKVDKERDYMI